MPPASIVLIVHVLCGVLWVGTCASFVLAASALNRESGEWRDFALKVAPRINRINLLAACAIPLTGLGNLYFAGRARGFKFPPQFVGVLSAKIVLFLAMAAALAAAWSTEASMDPVELEINIDARASRRLVRLYGITVAMGTIALALGLWLSGT
jgi:putative copper export protein